MLRDFKKNRDPPTAETAAKRRGVLGASCGRAQMAPMRGQKSGQNDPPEGVISRLRKGNSALWKGKFPIGKGKMAHLGSKIDPICARGWCPKWDSRDSQSSQQWQLSHQPPQQPSTTRYQIRLPYRDRGNHSCCGIATGSISESTMAARYRPQQHNPWPSMHHYTGQQQWNQWTDCSGDLRPAPVSATTSSSPLSSTCYQEGI